MFPSLLDDWNGISNHHAVSEKFIIQIPCYPTDMLDAQVLIDYMVDRGIKVSISSEEAVRRDGKFSCEVILSPAMTAAGVELHLKHEGNKPARSVCIAFCSAMIVLELERMRNTHVSTFGLDERKNEEAKDV